MSTPDPYDSLNDFGREAVMMYTTDHDGEWVMTDAIAEVVAMTPDERQWHRAMSTEARYRWVRDHLDDFAPPFAIVKVCAAAAIGFGDNPKHVDWDRFWDSLESCGWEMGEYGKASSQMERIVRKARAEGEIQW